MSDLIVTPTHEEWKQAHGFEGLYDVSNLGRVRSARTGRILKPGTRGGGYRVVMLRMGGANCPMNVARLVLLAFEGDPLKAIQCNHKNGNKRDDRACNLEWVTRSENVRHAIDVLGRKPTPRSNYPKGEEHHWAKLTQEQVESIRGLLDSGVGQVKIAEQFGIAQQTVSKIKTREHWSHVA